MKISFAMIWDLLNMQYPELETPIYDSHEVRGVKLLGSESPLESHSLYLGSCTEGIRICIGGKSDILKTEMGLEELFNAIQDIFNRLRDWDMDTHLALIEGCDIQRLVDISEAALCNPVTVMNPSYSLVAISSHENTESEIFNDVRRSGYLPPETVERYRLRGYMDTLTKAHDEVVFLSSDSCISVIWPLRLNGVIGGYLSMPCIPRPYSLGLAECFRYLAEGIALCMERQLHTSDINRYMYEYLLIDILDRKLTKEAALAERLRYIDLPARGEFALVLVESGQDYAAVGSYLSRRVAELLPGDRVFLYQNGILVLLRRQRLDIALQSLGPFLKDKGFSCGVSRDFPRLLDLPEACTQARAALRLGRGISQKRTLEKLGVDGLSYEKTLYRYDDYAVYHMVEASAEKGMISPLIRALAERDIREGSDNLRVLRAFLLCERRPTQTAAFLHMHRNNVIYRIDRIESMLGISLADNRVRQELELSLLALELMEAEAIVRNAQ